MTKTLNISGAKLKRFRNIKKIKIYLKLSQKSFIVLNTLTTPDFRDFSKQNAQKQKTLI